MDVERNFRVESTLQLIDQVPIEISDLFFVLASVYDKFHASVGLLHWKEVHDLAREIIVKSVFSLSKIIIHPPFFDREGVYLKRYGLYLLIPILFHRQGSMSTFKFSMLAEVGELATDSVLGGFS